MSLVRFFRFGCVLSASFATGMVFAAPRDVASLFPGISIAQVNWTLQNLSAGGTSAYQHFYDCAIQKTAAACSATDLFFFQFTNGTSPENSHNLMNRCMRVREDLSRASNDWVTLDSATQSVVCNPGPDEIHQLQLVLCYESAAPAPGAYCRMATVCFAGAKAIGGCGRDERGDVEIPVSAAP